MPLNKALNNSILEASRARASPRNMCRFRTRGFSAPPDENGRPFAPAPVVLDVVIVGGGPAGLTAALVLGRCRRRVLVVDSGRPRNADARAMHGYLGRDGTPPKDLGRIAREQLRQYESVALQ